MIKLFVRSVHGDEARLRRVGRRGGRLEGSGRE